METVKASSRSSKVSQFLHLIAGTTTVQLDNPSAQLLVHGISTWHFLVADIDRELTTYDSGLALARQPRWLTSADRRHTVGKLNAARPIALLASSWGQRFEIFLLSAPLSGPVPPPHPLPIHTRARGLPLALFGPRTVVKLIITAESYHETIETSEIGCEDTNSL